jgi:hypothetical protein
MLEAHYEQVSLQESEEIFLCTHQVPIVPSQRNSYCRIDESPGQLSKCACGWVEGAHLPETLHHKEYVNADDDERNECADLANE